MDYKLDENNDVVVEDGDWVFVIGVEAIAQHIRIKFQFFFREWKLDTRIGIDYYGQIFGKSDLNVVHTLFKRVILETEGVINLDKFETDLTAQREFSVDFTAQTVEGELVFSERFIL